MVTNENRPASGPILSGTKVHGPATAVRGVVFYYRTNLHPANVTQASNNDAQAFPP